MTISSFDELNNIGRERVSVPYKAYFGDMDLSDNQKEEREKMAVALEEKILLVMALIASMIESESIDISYASNFLYEEYLSVFSEFYEIDVFINNYIRGIASDIVKSTLNNIDDVYFLSIDRAMSIAENEANTCFNHADFDRALKEGKTHKVWVDVRDSKERKSHVEVGGSVVGINDKFQVGDSEMLYPKDTSLGASAEEIINCRCTIQYV